VRLSVATITLMACGVSVVGCGGRPVVVATPSTASPTMTASVSPTPPAQSAERYLRTWPLPPECPVASANAPTCTLNIPRNGSGGSYQAAATEYILLRAGWGDPTRHSCDEYASNTTTTITIDGHAVTSVAVPCQLVSDPVGSCGNQWRFDIRYLSAPLPPGAHTAVATITYNTAVSGASGCTGPQGANPAGMVQTFKKTVIVS
jgi:hypothetical protein